MSLALTSANASILLAVSLSGPKLKLTSLEDAMADWQWWLLGPLRPRTESARRKRGSPRFFDSKQRYLGPFCVGRSRQRRFSKRRDVRTRSSGLIEVPSNKIVLTVFRAGESLGGQ